MVGGRYNSTGGIGADLFGSGDQAFYDDRNKSNGW